jgi:D-alanine--D-alanine ligase
MAKKRIAVLFGGASKDHKASLASAFDVIDALHDEHYDVIPIGITKAGRWLYYPGTLSKIADGSWEEDSDCCSAVLSPDPHHGGILKIYDSGEVSILRVDVLFNVLHGKYGECGRIQGLCKLSGIAYVGCDDETAAITSSKALTYLTLQKAGIQIPEFTLIDRSDQTDLYITAKQTSEHLSYPLFIKASSCSSSVGASLATNHDAFVLGAKLAFSHHHQAVVEEAIFGKDVTCMVFGNSYHVYCTEVGEISPENYEAVENSKYVVNLSVFRYPADLDTSTSERVKQTAILAYKAVGCRGYARVDLKVFDDKIFCVKIHSLPGLTRTGICATLAQHSGISYNEMLERFISCAFEARNS